MSVAFEVKVVKTFADIETGFLHKEGEVFSLSDQNRVKNILNLKLARLLSIKHSERKSGKKVIIFANDINIIGGIETSLMNLARTFPDKNVLFLFKTADSEQMMVLGQNHDVEIDNGDKKYCDVLMLCNYSSILLTKNHIKAKRTYQMVHADFRTLKKIPIWSSFDWKPDKSVDKVVCCSKTAQEGLKEAFNIESVVARNILKTPSDSDFKLFVSLTRLTPEKGAENILKLAHAFKQAGKRFLWIISATKATDFAIDREINKIPEIIRIEPRIENKNLIKNADYLVQLSGSESYCYSIHEALAEGTPVIATDLEETRKIIKNGKNGWLIDDFDNIPIEKIFDKKLNFAKTTEPLDENWEKLLEGKL